MADIEILDGYAGAPISGPEQDALQDIIELVGGIAGVALNPETGQVTMLDLGGTRMFELPESVGNLQNLQLLYLDHNQLAALPDSIGHLPSLHVLDVGHNQLATIPESIGALPSLLTLIANYNYISTLPESIGAFPSLQNCANHPRDHHHILPLALARERLTPPLEGVESLRLYTLYLDHNELRHLPPSIGNLGALVMLTLDHNQITSLPESVGDIASLEVLDVAHNRLPVLPEGLGDCMSLCELDVSWNQLATVPAWFSHVERLKLEGNPLA